MRLSRNALSWETRITAPLYARRYSSNQRSESRSRWLVGSSRSRSDGSRRRSLARAIRICHPPENSSQSRSKSFTANPRPIRTRSTFDCIRKASMSSSLCWSSPKTSSVSAYSSLSWSSVESFCWASSISACTSTTSSNAVSASLTSVFPPAITPSWGRYPTVTYRALVTRPEVASPSPARIFSSVDFPDPFEPTRPILSCGPTVCETSSKRVRSP